MNITLLPPWLGKGSFLKVELQIIRLILTIKPVENVLAVAREKDLPVQSNQHLVCQDPLLRHQCTKEHHLGAL